MKVKKASLDNYKPYYGEGEDDVMMIIGKQKLVSEVDDDAMVQYEKEQAKIKKMEVLRNMLSGTKF
jgi:hypothetical protein